MRLYQGYTSEQLNALADAIENKYAARAVNQIKAYKIELEELHDVIVNSPTREDVQEAVDNLHAKWKAFGSSPKPNIGNDIEAALIGTGLRSYGCIIECIVD